MSSAHTGPNSGSPVLRRALDDVPSYRAGAAPPPPPEGLTAYKIASNENPYPPLPGVLAAIADAAAGINRYPDFASSHLLTLLAEHTAAPVEQIALGTGSVALLQHAMQITCDDGDEVVYAWRSFEAYPILTRITGAVPVEVPLTSDHRHDIDAMLAALTDRTRVLILCSPNNPTGTALTTQDVVRVLTAVPDRVLVVLDEAYCEFVDRQHALDAAALLAAHPNLVVLRTFSKAYGLAGVRLGYALGSERVADALRAVATPFGISSLAQAAGMAVLAPAARADLERRVLHLVGERERVVTRLGGAAASDPQGNFVWLPLGDASTGFAALCAAQGLSVRAFPGEGVRATIAESAANDRLIALANGFVTR